MLSTLTLTTQAPAQDREFLAQFYTLSETSDWQLHFDGEVYTIGNADKKLAMTLDFRAGNYQHRNKHPAKEPLIKAVKIKQKLPETLIDATPGVLKDALMLAGRGVKITAIERNPILYVMVRQALSVLDEHSSIDYHFGDAAKRLPAYEAPVIYLDPMYPPKNNNKKGAQVKKDMQILHHIVGDDADAEQLFNAARAKNARLVVKRPGYAKPISDEKPSFVSQTGATRFDVYLPKSH